MRKSIEFTLSFRVDKVERAINDMKRKILMRAPNRLFFESINVNGNTFYNLCNGDVYILYHDGTKRYIKSTWYDDVETDKL
jgi:hypothetical protein